MKWLVLFYWGRLSSAQLDRWQAPKQQPIIDPHPVEQTIVKCDFTQMLIKWYFIKAFFWLGGKPEIRNF